MSLAEVLPSVNAALNATSTALIVAAFVAVRNGRVSLHRRLMLSAVACSALFLASYVARTLLTGTHRFPDVGWVKHIYLVILFSHMALALLVLPLVLRTVYLGLKRDDARHRRIARLTFPVWLYVSLTGVVVYGMLYHLAPRLAAG